MMSYFDSGCMIDNSLIKKLRMRLEVDDNYQQKLKKLKIRGKDLNELPAEIFCITELEVLDLSPERQACMDYRMSRLPSNIGNLLNLKVLILDTNYLESIPPELGRLQNLEQLFLSNNRLTEIPEEFSSLVNLESLHLSNNNLTTFPEPLCSITSLQFLDISGNETINIPEEICNLTNLRSFIANFNKIERLPDSICELTNLTTLWLGHNRLKKLPRNFGKLINLDWGIGFNVSSVIDENPLTNPPVDVCKRGVEAIEEYFSKFRK